MRKLLRAAFAVVLAAAASAAAACVVAAPAQAADSAYKVLVFSKTAGFRHDSIGVGITAIQQLGTANNFTVTATEDAAAFTTANLAQFQAVVFLNTTGDVLNATQQTAFESYINGGGGYVGVHAAADTEYGWPYYGTLVGAWFASHPAIQSATQVIEDRAHAATQHLGPTWTRTDEWYNYQTNARSTAHVLTALNESSYSGGGMGADHPLTWCKTVGGGRSFYTGNGHTQESYADPAFRSLLLGGIRYAAGKTKADCRAETGYTDIYNGSLTGWSQAGPGGFTNSNGTLTSFDGLGMLWYSAKQYGAYSLKLDWRMAGDDNSGIFIGFPPSSDPWSAVNNGYEIQIDATDAADRTTGSVYTFKSADIAARDAALNPPGEWNTYEILVEGERVQLFLNGRKINDFTNTNPVRSLQQGHIGIQNHGTGDDVSFRHIRIKELGTPPGGDVTVQAESFSSASGVQPFTKAGAHNGQTLGYIEPGDWSAYNGVNLAGVTQFRARVVSGGPGGAIQVRTGSTTGPILGTVTVPNTGNWDTYADVQTTLTGVPNGTANLYLTYTGTGTGLFDLDDFTLVKTTTPPGTPVQAESFTSQSGVQIVADAGAQGGNRVGYVDNGDWIGFAGVTAAGATSVTVRAASGGSGGTVQVRTGSSTGPLLGSVAVPNTGGYGNWQNFTTALTAGSGPVHLVFTGSGGGLLDVDSFTLTTGGSTGVGPVRGLANKCLDVNNSGTADGTKIQLYTCNGSAAQTWTVQGQVLRALGKCLDVSGGGTADGTLVQLWTCNGSAAQNWQAQADGTLRNPNSGKCLDVSGNNSADGTQIHIWTCIANAANQKWTLP